MNTTLRRSSMTRRFVAPPLFVSLVWLAAACGQGPPRDDVRADSLRTDSIAPPDSALAIDTTANQPLDSALPALPDIQETTTPASTLDSLRQDLAAVRALLARQDSLAADTTSGIVETGQDLVQDAALEVRFLGIRIFWALIVLLAAYFVIQAAGVVLDRLAERFTTRRLFIKRLVPIVRLAVWSLAVYYVITGVFRVDRTSLLAATAAVSVAIALAAQDVLKNIIGGLIIVLDRPFQVGDKIRVDETYGEVVAIGLRATRIQTPDDNLVSVPNLKVVEGQVANANAGALDCQVVVDLFVPGWVDTDMAKQVAYDAAISSRYTYLDKPVVVLSRDEFRETFLTRILVKAYVLDTRYEFLLASDVTETAKREFRARGFLPPLSRLGYAPQPASGQAS